MLSKATEYRENAANCAELEARAPDRPKKKRYQRMKEAWLALAEEQDWLEGQSAPPERDSRSSDFSQPEPSHACDDGEDGSDDRCKERKRITYPALRG